MAFFSKHCAIRIQLLRPIAAIPTYIWITHAKRCDVLNFVLTVCVLFCLFQQAATAQGLYIPEPTPPPRAVREAFDLDPFYQQWIDVKGFPVVASAHVNPYALKEAAYLIHKMMAHRPDILRASKQHRSRFAIIGYNERTTQIPEYRTLQPDFYVDKRSRGLGGFGISSASEENLLHYPEEPYSGGFSMLMHEFAHHVEAIHHKVDPGFDARLRMAYEAAMARGLWANTYAAVNQAEYWAEASEAWLYPKTASSFDRFGDTRADLKAYDPALAVLLTEVYGDRNWRYTPVVTRAGQAHLRGFDPQHSPTFQWPPELLALNEAFEKDPESTGGGRWVNLEPHPPSELPRLRVSRHRGDPTTIVIANFGVDTLQVYSIEPNGTEVFYGSTYQGYNVAFFETSVGALWLLKDTQDNTLSVYRAEAEMGRVLILPDTDTKIEGPWLWMIAPTQDKLSGSDAAASGTDYLAVASHGAVTEQAIATNGAIAGAKVGNKVWTSGKLAPTGDDNITEAVTTIGLTRRASIEYHVAYGFIPLNVPHQQSTVMHVGSDDAVKVWLNGVLVHNNPTDRGADDYKESVSVKLKKGRNILLIAVYQGWGGWSGFFGFKKDAVYSMTDDIPQPKQVPLVRHVPHPRPPAMYWIDTQQGGLHQAIGTHVESLLPNVRNATSLATDVAGGKLYWTEKTSDRTGSIHRANLAGKPNVRLVKELTSVPLDIALDAAAGKIYLANSWGKIQSLNVDGTGFKDLIKGVKALSEIALDVAGGKVYWTEKANSVRRANLDGSTVETVATGLANPTGIAISDGKLYWTTQPDARGGDIQRANLDGSAVETLATVPGAPEGIVVDPLMHKVYWANTLGSIQRADLDGQNVQTLIIGLRQPANLVLGEGLASIPEPIVAPLPKITGPWLWMIAPTAPGQGGAKSTDVDSLRIASHGAVTEAQVAAQGAKAGDVVGNYAWTPGKIAPTGENNINDVVNQIGLVKGQNQKNPLDDRDINDHSAYALITLVSAEARSGVRMQVGSDDSIKVWLNGKVVHKNAVDRGATDFLDGFTVHLNPGNNLLLVKVSELWGGWSLFVGIDADVKVTLPAGAAAAAPLFGVSEIVLPTETVLLANYPNPFNPETWIPYQLSEAADVTVSIYAADGRVVRTLAFGHQDAGLYHTRSRAAYWDGKNGLGEPVASGVYFYTLTAGDFAATRKMLIVK